MVNGMLVIDTVNADKKIFFFIRFFALALEDGEARTRIPHIQIFLYSS